VSPSSEKMKEGVFFEEIFLRASYLEPGINPRKSSNSIPGIAQECPYMDQCGALKQFLYLN